jgi:hypothetical protein
MARFALVLMWSLVMLGLAASAQTIQVSRDNKTIYVTSEGEAKAEPDIAILTLGYHAWSKTKDALYDESATVSDKVLAISVGCKERNDPHGQDFAHSRRSGAKLARRLEGKQGFRGRVEMEGYGSRQRC